MLLRAEMQQPWGLWVPTRPNTASPKMAAPPGWPFFLPWGVQRWRWGRTEPWRNLALEPIIRGKIAA